MKNFVLIGAGGYIAPKHMKAMKEIGGNLLAALDKHDSVGVLDSYFPHANFFTEFERFDRHCDKLRRNGTPIHYVSVCSPNYLHDAHCRFGLRMGADVICEKPVVLNPWNVDALMETENETGKNVYTVLQLRLHPAVQNLKNKISSDSSTKHIVDLQYVTARGSWYFSSWKGDIDKSGGIATNIGVHFFDLLLWIFGDVEGIEIYTNEKEEISGKLILEKAEVNWLLSIDEQKLPQKTKEDGKRVFRSLNIDGATIELTNGFDELHTQVYREILDGNGVHLFETRKSIQLVHDIRDRQSE